LCGLDAGFDGLGLDWLCWAEAPPPGLFFGWYEERGAELEPPLRPSAAELFEVFLC
jgi:hypothetical protein